MTTVLQRWMETEEGEIALDVTVEYVYRLGRFRDEDDDVLEVRSAVLTDGTMTTLTDDEFHALVEAVAPVSHGPDPAEYYVDDDAWRVGQDAFERCY